MKSIEIYLRIYADCFRLAFKGLLKSPWTLLLPSAMVPAFLTVGAVVSKLGFVGGILFSLAFDALLSCYLYFTAEVVAQRRVSLRELGLSFGRYFWTLMNFLFILWLAKFVIGLIPEGTSVRSMANLALGLFLVLMLNPVPEVIYQRGTYGGLETIRSSIQFLQENWIEWFAPQVAVGALIFVFLGAVPSGPGGILSLAVGGAVLHVMMVFRGHLFKVLSQSSHRQRMFRYRDGM